VAFSVVSNRPFEFLADGKQEFLSSCFSHLGSMEAEGGTWFFSQMSNSRVIKNENCPYSQSAEIGQFFYRIAL
jgi:hypothetical protein